MIQAPAVFEIPITTIKHVPCLLLVNETPALLRSRALLLKSLPSIVDCVESCRSLYGSGGRSYALIILALQPGSEETAEAALFCRRQWASARILLLEREDYAIDDWLYDDRLDPLYNPAALCGAARRLLMGDRC